MDFKIKGRYLTSGYVRCEYLIKQSEDTNFEVSLINVILTFLGNIFVLFDCYPKNCQQFIFDHGQVFRKQCKFMEDYAIFGSSIKWGKGEIHQISFKSNTKAHGWDAVGISTNIEKLCEKTGWFTDRVEATNSIAFVRNGGSILSWPIDLRYDTQSRILKADDCKKGDIFSLLFNGIDWTLTYLLNGERTGKPQSIKPDLEYSPFICDSKSHHDRDYEIVHDQTW